MPGPAGQPWRSAAHRLPSSACWRVRTSRAPRRRRDGMGGGGGVPPARPPARIPGGGRGERRAGCQVPVTSRDSSPGAGRSQSQLFHSSRNSFIMDLRGYTNKRVEGQLFLEEMPLRPNLSAWKRCREAAFTGGNNIPQGSSMQLWVVRCRCL